MDKCKTGTFSSIIVSVYFGHLSINNRNINILIASVQSQQCNEYLFTKRGGGAICILRFERKLDGVLKFFLTGIQFSLMEISYSWHGQVGLWFNTRAPNREEFLEQSMLCLLAHKIRFIF